MDEKTTQNKKAKTSHIAWKEIAVQSGVFLLQGALMTLGGIAVSRMAGTNSNALGADSSTDKVLPLRKVSST